MKKVFLLMMVAATMLFTQCKKNEVVTPTGGNKVEITLTLDNNSKIDVNTSSGAVTFEKGDQIYVAYGGKCVGMLSYDGAEFKGYLEIEETAAKEGNLYFYFLGNKTPIETEGEEPASSLTVDIMDQSKGLSVISFGRSNEVYPTTDNYYTAELKNKCALVKFNVSSDKESSLVGQVGVKGLLNEVSVNLTTNRFEFKTAKGSEGIIKLNKVGKSGNEYWAVLLPQETALQPTGETFAYSTEGLYGSFTTSIQSIKPNGLYNDEGGCVTVTLNNEREFSISADKKVRFSPGNLYYDYVPGSSYDGSRVHFETDQRDFSTEKPDASHRICHFKWVNDKSPFWTVITNNPNSASTLFCGSEFCVDSISSWFTMSKGEYLYLVENGKITTTKRINVCYGAIILPDDYEGDVKGSYTETEWLVEESKGVVALPAAAYWNSFTDGRVTGDNLCRYWINTLNGNTKAYTLGVDSASVGVASIGIKQARSIRLVKECQ